MRVFLFRNSVNPIDYCVTATKPVRLPSAGSQGRWLFERELQNAMHAAVFGLPNYEAVVNAIDSRGYFRYSEPRMLRAAR